MRESSLIRLMVREDRKSWTHAFSRHGWARFARSTLPALPDHPDAQKLCSPRRPPGGRNRPRALGFVADGQAYAFAADGEAKLIATMTGTMMTVVGRDGIEG